MELLAGTWGRRSTYLWPVDLQGHWSCPRSFRGHGCLEKGHQGGRVGQGRGAAEQEVHTLEERVARRVQQAGGGMSQGLAA